MSVEVNHLIVPATDKVASANSYADPDGHLWELITTAYG